MKTISWRYRKICSRRRSSALENMPRIFFPPLPSLKANDIYRLKRAMSVMHHGRLEEK